MCTFSPPRRGVSGHPPGGWKNRPLGTPLGGGLVIRKQVERAKNGPIFGPILGPILGHFWADFGPGPGGPARPGPARPGREISRAGSQRRDPARDPAQGGVRGPSREPPREASWDPVWDPVWEGRFQDCLGPLITDPTLAR